MARCRIGHTYLTHSYLLKSEPIPECIPCGEILSIKHVLIDCVDFAPSRARYYTADSLKELFDNVDPAKILGFIKDIGLFRRF